MVSIIIPVFNRAKIIGETLDSIISQSYRDWECIIVDDGSTDETIKVINQFIGKDDRFKLFERPKNRPKGANACRNFGFEQAKGEYINWFDSDDIMHPDFLKLKRGILDNDQSLDFCACISRKFVDTVDEKAEEDRPLVLNSNNYIEDYLLHGLYFYTPSPMWRTSFLKGKDLFDEALHRSQERDFHFRMLTHNPNYFYLEEVLFYVRVEGDSISTRSKTSLKAQTSVFNYFHKVFDHLNNNENVPNRETLLQYVFYRQATNYYNINQLSNGFKQRFNILSSKGKSLKQYCKSTKQLSKHSRHISIGFMLVLFLNKGYKYFYFPQYDYAKKG